MVAHAAFVMFYLPCLATLSALKRELGSRPMLVIGALGSAVLIRAAALLI